MSLGRWTGTAEARELVRSEHIRRTVRYSGAISSMWNCLDLNQSETLSPIFDLHHSCGTEDAVTRIQLLDISGGKTCMEQYFLIRNRWLTVAGLDAS